MTTTGRMLFGDVGPYPILRMRQWYVEHADELLMGFDEELDLYTLNGEVHSTKTLFAMFRPVVAGADAALICNPRVEFREDDINCWFIAAAAGDIGQLYKWESLKLPYICWVNRGEMYTMEMDRAKRILTSVLNLSR